MWSRMLKAGSVLGVAALALTVLVQSGAEAATSPTEYYDWPNYQGNSLHDGLAPGKGLHSGTKRLWSFDAPGQTLMSTIIAGGVVYTVGSDDDGPVVYAFEARTGKQLWKVTPPTAHCCSAFIAYEGGRVFVEAVGGALSALDARTGDTIWTRPGEGRAAQSPITTYRGRIYIVRGDATPSYFEAVDQADGRLIFSKQVRDGGMAPVTAWASGVYVSVQGSEDVRRYDTTGKQVWANSAGGTPSYGGRAPVLHDSKIYAGDLLLRSRIITGSRGTTVGSLDTYQTPAFSGTTVFVIDVNRRLSAVSLTDGHTIWTTPAETARDLGCTTSPTISLNVVYCGRGDGFVRGYNIRNGAQVWSGDAGAPFPPLRGQPGLDDSSIDGRLAIGNAVLAATTDHRLTVFG